MWLLKLLLAGVVVYFAVVAVMYAAQTRMLFPTGLTATTGTRLPATAERLEVETADGERLQGLHIPPARDVAGPRLLILGFGGNAWNGDDVAAYLHGLFPEADVVAFHYRGYPPSSGDPSAAALLADAPLVYDRAMEAVGAQRVVAVGLSIGGGVAAHLATQRPLAGLILVTPFDSLEALAGEHFPWAPVRWLLRHRMSPLESLRDLAVPTALIAAERDNIVAPRRTEALRQGIPAPVFDRTIAGADHNDLYGRPEFRAAMAEALAKFE